MKEHLEMKIQSICRNFFNVFQCRDTSKSSNKIIGYLDQVIMQDNTVILRGWALNSNGKPLNTFQVKANDQSFDIWEIERIPRKDVTSVIECAEENCGFIIKIKVNKTEYKTDEFCIIAIDSTNKFRKTLKRSQTKNNEDTLKKNKINEQSSDRRIESDAPYHVNDINFVVVYGLPGSGKSSFCNSLSRSNQDILLVSTDSIFDTEIYKNDPNAKKYWVSGPPYPHFSIGEYVDSCDYDEELFVRFLKEHLKQLINSNPRANLIMLDGYVFKNFKSILNKLDIPEKRMMAFECEKRGGVYQVSDMEVNNYTYDKVESYIFESFKNKCLKSTIPESHYQNFNSFDWMIDKQSTASESTIKYLASHLDDVVEIGDNCLDIGCNAGYFVFKMALKTNADVWGVDFVSKWLKIASHIKCSIFRFQNVFFYKSDALEFLAERRKQFDVIHCASTFHYFRNKQKQFLINAHESLVKNGLLVIEVELAETINVPELIKKARGVDSEPCYFPNKLMFLAQIDGLYEVEREYISTFQKGSFFNRTYFHLRAI